MPLRAFGVASKAEIIKEVWLPVLFGTDVLQDLASVNGPPSILVDTAADYAMSAAYVPPSPFSTIRDVHVLIHNVAGIANMKFDAYGWYVGPGGFWTHFGGGMVNVTLAADNPTFVNVTAALGFAGLPNVAGIPLSIGVLYNVMATASNFYFYGARIRWN